MPGAIDERGFARSPLDDEPALLIRADGSKVIVHHPQGDAMRLEDIECIAQNKSDGLTAEALYFEFAARALNLPFSTIGP